MPDSFNDRLEREVALNGPEWIRFLWALWAIKQASQLWLLVRDGELACSPGGKADSVIIFPSAGVAADAALGGWRPKACLLTDIDGLGSSLEVWPAFQPAYHGGTRVSPEELKQRVASCSIDIRSQLATRPLAVGYLSLEPMPELAALIPAPVGMAKLPRPRPAAQVNGVMRSPAPNRFKFMLSTTFWVAVSSAGPLGARLDDGTVALCSWPAPEFMVLGPHAGEAAPVKLGWGQDVLRPLAERNASLLAAPTADDGLLCSPGWFAMPDLNALSAR